MSTVERRALAITLQHVAGLVAIAMTGAAILRATHGGSPEWLMTGVFDVVCVGVILWSRRWANKPDDPHP